MIEHPEAGRVDPIAGDVHAVRRDSHERYGARKIKAALERRGVTASRRRIVNIMKRRGMTSAYARRTFKPHKTRVNEARLANILDREFDGYEPRTHLASDLTYVRVGGKWAYVCLLIDLANRSIAGHSADTSRTADLVMAAFATLDFPLTEVEVFHTDRGQRVRQRENRQAARRVRHQKIAVKEGQPVRQRRGRIHQQAPEEGAHIPEPLHQPGTTTLRPRRLCVVVRQPKTPLHPRIPEPEGIHRTRTRPLKNCPTRRCQSSVIGCFALVQTRTSNELAQDADAVSKEGVALAGTAKEIAAEANQKADKANEISERALAVGSDQTVYHWRCAYDGDAGKVVVNESPNKATDVTVVFRFQDVTLADARQDVVAGFGELALDAPLVADYLARDAAELRRAAAGGLIINRGACLKVEMHVAFTSELGIRRNDAAEEVIGKKNSRGQIW